VLVFVLLLSCNLALSNQPKPFEQTVANQSGRLPFDTASEMTVAVMVKPAQPGVVRHLGSAVWVGKNGYLVTCSHVIA
jgi:hypothetical protein